MGGFAYRTDDFDFILPNDLIAQQPLENREDSRLLYFNNGRVLDKNFTHILDFVDKNCLLVFNDSKVINAKLLGYNSNGVAININLNKKIFGDIWEVFVKPAKKIRNGEKLNFADGFYAIVMEKMEMGVAKLEFFYQNGNFLSNLQSIGKIPIPPYIKTKNSLQNEKYQTIYGKKYGAVAASTAGLHFSEKIFYELNKKQVKIAFVTLYVGGGTFLPVKSEYIDDHKIHGEYYEIDEENSNIISRAMKEGRKIIAVGTTSLRVLESVYNKFNEIKPTKGETEIFIKPGYRFSVINALITNFHLPKSTLIMLVSALIGLENMKKIYEHAIAMRYRFFSFGDACFFDDVI